MPRALTILKYLPAVLCGLLVVAWVMSLFGNFDVVYVFPYGYRRDGAIERYSLEAGVAIGTVRAFYGGGEYDKPGVWTRSHMRQYASDEWLGRLTQPSDLTHHGGLFPIPFLLALLLPLAIGPFIRFRFPLWTWFAFTALVAVELAYYLR